MAQTKATSGKNARATANGTLIDVTNWEITWTGDLIDDTGTEEGGYQHKTPGTQIATWRVDGYWDASANQMTSPLNIGFGVELTTCIQYLNANAGTSVTTGKNWALGTTIVNEVRNSSEVHGGIKLSWTATTQGSFTPPT
jgi:hypothetical protein